MSKKLSKVLVVAVVLVLSMSLFALVACGGPEPLDSKGAQAELQKNFNNTPAKVTEKVKIGNIDIKVGAIAELRIDNVDVLLVREYKADGSMVLECTVSNLKVKVAKGWGLISSFLPKDKVGNFDETVIDNFSKVELYAKVTMKNPGDCDPSDLTTYENYLHLDSFEIRNLSEVKDASGVKWSILKDGDGNDLTEPYSPGELFKDGKDNINPRHVKADGEPDGIFAAMDKYGKADKDGNKPGEILEQFIADNYKMVSAYKFDKMNVDGEKISYKGKANLNDVYTVGNKVLKSYEDTKIGAITPTPIKTIISLVFGSTKDVKGVVEAITDLGTSEVTMDGTIKAINDKWQLATLNTSQVVKVTLKGDYLKNALDKVLPKMADVDLSSYMDLIGPALEGGLSTDVKATVNATFEY